MSKETCKGLLTPTGELSLKDKKIQCLNKSLLEDIAEKILLLDLRNNFISHLENNALANLTHLRALDLRGNKLEVFCESISALTHLKILKLDHNLLTTLPCEVFKLPLTMLTLSDNSLFSISPKISETKSLIVLVVSENQIKAIPSEIGELSNLKTFHMHGNEFSTLPTALSLLSSLEEISLEWLRYTSPGLSKVVKGHVGDAIICSLREMMYKKSREGVREISLKQFLDHFSERNFSINKADIRKRSLLHLAVSNGDIGVVKGLIEAGCELDLMDIDDFTPLVIGLRENNVHVAKVLVQAGARLDLGGGSFGSVLNLAVIKSEPWLVKAIIQAGIDVNVKDCEGNSCLHHLMTVHKKHKHRNALIADMLVEAGVELNVLNQEKWAAVHIAARKGQSAAFRWIANKNIFLKQQGKEGFDLDLLGGNHGWTPLHVASHSGHYKTVETLVICGASAYIRNYSGKTPKDTSKGDLAIYKFLSRAETTHIKLLTQSVSSRANSKINPQTEGLAEKYEKAYKLYAENNIEELENMLGTEVKQGVKADVVYLLSKLKEHKTVTFISMTMNSEESLVKQEANSALALNTLENSQNNVHTLIGPKLPRSSPLQMSLPTNISAYLEEETRIDSMLII